MVCFINIHGAVSTAGAARRVGPAHRGRPRLCPPLPSPPLLSPLQGSSSSAQKGCSSLDSLLGLHTPSSLLLILKSLFHALHPFPRICLYLDSDLVSKVDPPETSLTAVTRAEPTPQPLEAPPPRSAPSLSFLRSTVPVPSWCAGHRPGHLRNLLHPHPSSVHHLSLIITVPSHGGAQRMGVIGKSTQM